MIKIYYTSFDYYVGEVLTNHSLTLDDMLNLINFNEEEFKNKHSIYNINYEDFFIIYQ